MLFADPGRAPQHHAVHPELRRPPDLPHQPALLQEDAARRVHGGEGHDGGGLPAVGVAEAQRLVQQPPRAVAARVVHGRVQRPAAAPHERKPVVDPGGMGTELLYS